MLGLHDHVDRGALDRRRVVRDDHHLRRACERRRDADEALPRDLALRDRHVDVARPHDHVDGHDRLGAVRHRGDCLRATERVDLVDLGDRGRGERRLRHLAGRPIWRHAQRDLRDARDARGDRGHQHGRRIHRSSTRDVATRAVDGHGDGAHDDAVALVAGLGARAHSSGSRRCLPRLARSRRATSAQRLRARREGRQSEPGGRRGRPRRTARSAPAARRRHAA